MDMDFAGNYTIDPALDSVFNAYRNQVSFAFSYRFVSEYETQRSASFRIGDAIDPLRFDIASDDTFSPQRVDVPEGSLGISAHSELASPIRSSSSSTSSSTHSRQMDRHQNALNQLLGGLSQMRYVPASRGLVRSKYEQENDISADIPLKNGLGVQEEKLATNLVYSPIVVRMISPWMKKIAGIGIQADTVPGKFVEARSLTATGENNLALEGFGTNSLVLLFQELARSEQRSTVLIEEPEIHLHPKAQPELASLLAEVAEEQDKQLIMTTYSEHILGRFLKLVAEKKLSPDDLAIYAFEKDDEGVCTAKELTVTEDGRVEGGIPDFFEPNLEELDRYIKAQATE